MGLTRRAKARRIPTATRSSTISMRRPARSSRAGNPSSRSTRKRRNWSWAMWSSTAASRVAAATALHHERVRARRRSGVRCAHRAAAVGVSHSAAGRREFGADTWEDESWEYTGHAPVWAPMSADPELGYVYLPGTSPTSDMYGGHRGGDNLFGQSLVCVDAVTGERVWHYQLVHHGLWDYDLPAPPILMDVAVEGRPGITKMVVQLTKQAFAFAFDRVTGEPVWPIEERPVSQSSTPSERTSPTQPFPTKPPAFDRQGATVDNLIDFTPDLYEEALDIVSRYTMGPMFTPPTIRTERMWARSSFRGRKVALMCKAEPSILTRATSMCRRSPLRLWRTSSKATRNEPTSATSRDAVSGSAGPADCTLFKPPYGRMLTGISVAPVTLRGAGAGIGQAMRLLAVPADPVRRLPQDVRAHLSWPRHTRAHNLPPPAPPFCRPATDVVEHSDGVFAVVAREGHELVQGFELLVRRVALWRRIEQVRVGHGRGDGVSSFPSSTGCRMGSSRTVRITSFLVITAPVTSWFDPGERIVRRPLPPRRIRHR